MVVKEDGAVENGDTVNIDFSGSVDGEEFDGGQAEGYDLKLVLDHSFLALKNK